jgi:hypothetical protein
VQAQFKFMRQYLRARVGFSSAEKVSVFAIIVRIIANKPELQMPQFPGALILNTASNVIAAKGAGSLWENACFKPMACSCLH